jgi:hypothetical protein
LRIISTGIRKYTISWEQPPLPDQQTVLKYYANYGASRQSSKNKASISNQTTYITINVMFDQEYDFEIQVRTEAGKSEVTKISWFSHSGIMPV